MKNIVVSVNDIEVFSSPKQYKQQLLLLIAGACKRIYITALYLQDDEAGRDILHALYQAKNKTPELDIKIFVDYHRGQRGLIGEKESLGNRALYLQLAEQYQEKIEIYGVAVKNKEVFGVLHLKGMVFDEQLFYTGASINDIYMHQGTRYRLDRYYKIKSAELTQSFCQYLQNTFVDSELSPLLNVNSLPIATQQKRNIAALKSRLKKSSYKPLSLKYSMLRESSVVKDPIFITPLIGFGRRGNKLNKVIRKVVQNSQESLLIFTPYFNLPPVLARDVIKALKRGVKITIIVGDKTANDFYVEDDDDFSTIAIVPYVYEMLLKRFVKRYQKFIDQGLLNIHLWKDADNSFHLKGLIADNRYHLLTGSNLNPRAWLLDLENGILLEDTSKQLMAKIEPELVQVLKNTTRLTNHTELDAISDYPEKPRKLLKKIRIAQIDRILKRLL